ncbi:methyltransferase [[Mycoplasma] gypis]|uniref:Methyltransferase n=1 Tax=[Mycoplasma] gypis TaxID=92404 RepID=A0ABZ2RP12_9BACT|nr:methyltransferase [[Mycoplasma] gypis]MBN0919148.1 methyltransferase [[Mycoplasma] gypis]
MKEKIKINDEEYSIQNVTKYLNEQIETKKSRQKNDITKAFRYANDDEWYTTYEDVEFFIQNAKIPKDWVVWCPFDLETSNFVKAFKKNGYKVIYSHILYGQDFYEYVPNEKWDIIVSNPPFRNKHKLIERIIQLGQNKKFALIFGIQALNSEKFCNELQSLKRVQYVHLKRRMCFTKDHINYDIQNLQRPSFASMWICNDLLKKDIQVWEGINYKKINKEFS